LITFSSNISIKIFIIGFSRVSTLHGLRMGFPVQVETITAEAEGCTLLKNRTQEIPHERA
jgi:hypothetical protein